MRLVPTNPMNRVLAAILAFEAICCGLAIPGMITGSSTAAVLTTGALVAPVLLKLGVQLQKTAAVIAMGAIYGMIAPPISLPAMIIGGGSTCPTWGSVFLCSSARCLWRW